MIYRIKRVRDSWSFFVSYLKPGLLVFALGWLLLLGSTLLVSYLPRSSELYVQRWWLWGSALLVLFMAAMVVLLGKALSRSNGAILVPGWRGANFEVVLAWGLLLVLLPFLASGLWAWGAGERWDVGSLAWLCVAASLGFIAASAMSSLDSLWQELLQVFVLFSIVVSTVLVALSNRALSLGSVWWVDAANRPWLVAVASIALAIASFAYASRRRAQPEKSAVSLCVQALQSRIFSYSLRIQGRSALLTESSNLLVYSFLTFNVIFSSWLVGNLEVTDQWLFACFLVWYGLLASSFLSQLSLPRSAIMLMWLPAGLKRMHLGFEIFQVLLSRLFFLAVGYVLLVGATQWALNQPMRVLMHPELFLLLLCDAVLMAGCAVAFFRAGHKARPALVAQVSALVLPAVYLLTWQLAPPSAALNAAIALACAATGLLLGKRFSLHWGKQEISALLKPLNPLNPMP
jgi:hypothetical protein